MKFFPRLKAARPGLKVDVTGAPGWTPIDVGQAKAIVEMHSPRPLADIIRGEIEWNQRTTARVLETAPEGSPRRAYAEGRRDFGNMLLLLLNGSST